MEVAGGAKYEDKWKCGRASAFNYGRTSICRLSLSGNGSVNKLPWN